MTSAERTATLSKLALEIAYKLHSNHGQAWEFVEPTEDTYNVYMQNRQGARIYLGLSSSKGYDLCDRVTVSGGQHIGKHGAYVEVYQRDLGIVTDGWARASSPDITVALSRGADAIAKDIAKRFLPQYLRIFEAAMRKVAEQEAYELRITNTLKRVANAAGFIVPKLGEYDREVRSQTGGAIGNVDVTIKAYDGRVELKLDDLTVEEAESIIDKLQYLTQ